jgi:hypothetical protein
MSWSPRPTASPSIVRAKYAVTVPNLNTLRPVDDGACAHLIGMTIPAITLPATQGRAVNLGALPPEGP